MKIASQQIANTRRAQSAPPKAEDSSATPEAAPEVPAKKGPSLITKAASATGGATGGLLLGGLAGTLMTNVTGNPLFQSYGAAVGSVAGGGMGLAAATGDDKSTLIRSAIGWGTGTAGMAAGQWALGSLANMVTSNGGSAVFAQTGQLVGAASGLALGASIPFTGSYRSGHMVTKQLGFAALTGNAGWLAGGALQAICNTAGNPTLGMAAPWLGAAAGFFTGAASRAIMGDSERANEKLNKISESYAAYRQTVAVGSSLSGGAALGCVGGAIIGGFASNLNASPIYQVAAPVIGPALGALMSVATVGEELYSKQATQLAEKSATTLGFGALGAVVGDAVGHGLTYVSGNPLYSSIGGAVGALEGTMAGLTIANQDSKSPLFKGTLAGGTAGLGLSAGALAGALLDHMTGSHIYGTVAPILGGVAGALTGLAMCNAGDGSKKKSQQAA